MRTIINVQALRLMREARGWDQQTLARAAEIDPSVVSRLEGGHQDDLRASVLVALARALDVPIDELINGPAGREASYVLELTAVLPEVARLTEAQQRQVAAILRGYLDTVPNSPGAEVC